MKAVEVVVQLLVRSSSRSAIAAFKSGKLCGLGAELCGNIVWVSGQIRGEQLAVLLGSIVPAGPAPLQAAGKSSAA